MVALERCPDEVRGGVKNDSLLLSENVEMWKGDVTTEPECLF